MSFFGQSFPYAQQHPAYLGRRVHNPTATPIPHHPFHPSPPVYEPEYYPHPNAYTYGRSRPLPPSVPSPYDADFDAEEEQAALAHLQAIQQRRRATEARLNREAEIRAERELAFQAALQREKEQALKREKLAHARALALERIKERHRLMEAAAEAERQQREREQREIARAQSIDAWKSRLAPVARAKAYAFAQAQAQQVAREASLAAQEKKRQYCEKIREEQARRKACAEHCARRNGETEEQNKEQENKVEEDGLKIINGLLGGLFGINLVQEDVPKSTEDTKEPVVPVATEKKVTTPAVPQSTATTEQVQVDAPTPNNIEAAPTEPSPAFPSDLNDLISHFLGLRVDPAKDGEVASGQPDKNVIGGLNQLLGQFGLEFEPTTTETQVKASASASGSASGSGSGSGSSAPVNSTESVQTAPVEEAAAASKPASTPIADFLNGHYQIPPFVRDILSNVEVALTQGHDYKPKSEPEVQGKGKGVADGEKTGRPAPVSTKLHFESATPAAAESVETVSSTASIDKLDSIAHELYLATESFEFPHKLAFAPTNLEQPQLLFNKTNSGYHAQAHKLLQLLLAADGVSSGGDKDVRRKRKEVVRAVEGAIEALEKKRDDLWDQVKIKRENGEESDVEDGAISSGASTLSDIEHVELGDFEDHAGAKETKATTAPGETGVAGFNVDGPSEVVFDADVNVDEQEKVVEAGSVDLAIGNDNKEKESETPVEKAEVENQAQDSEEKVEPSAPAPKSPTSHSVTVEDQEEGYEVL